MKSHESTGNAIASIRQAVALIRALDDEVYATPEREVFGYSVGSHFRHLYEHYVQFRRGYPEGRINYDARERDQRFEQSRDYALQCLARLVEWLEGLPAGDADRKLLAKMDCGDGPACANWAHSTVKRELQYLVMHDVHHYAMLAFMLKARSIEVPNGFGVAPSTRAFHRADVPQDDRDA